MPIRFFCLECKQPLQITQRKVGTTINCPRCQAAVVVPKKSTLPKPVAKVETSQVPKTELEPAANPAPLPAKAPAKLPPNIPPPVDEEEEYEDDEDEGLISEFVVYDQEEDEDSSIAMTTPPELQLPTPAPSVPVPPTSSASPPVDRPPVQTVAVAVEKGGKPAHKVPVAQSIGVAGLKDAPESKPATVKETPTKSAETMEDVPDGMVVVSRARLYVQSVMLLVVAVGGYGAGYLAGYGDSLPPEMAEASVLSKGCLLDGRLVYMARPGEFEPDAGSLVVAFPAGAQPDAKLLGRTLRPTLAAAALDPFTLSELDKLGAKAMLVDKQGHFILTLPERGDYHLLFVSRATERIPGKSLSPDDINTLQRYVDDPHLMLEQNKFFLQKLTLACSP